MGFSPHEFGRVAYEYGISGGQMLSDPGTAGTINLKNSNFGICHLTIAAAAETRLLPGVTGVPAGTKVLVVANQLATSGTDYCIVTSNVSAHNIVMTAEGDFALYETMYINDVLTWVAVSRGGTGVSQRLRNPLTLTGDTTLTPTIHGDKTLYLGEVGGNALMTITLPQPSGTGRRYRMVVSVVNTSSYVIDADANDGIFQGTIITKTASESNDVAQAWTSAANDLLTLNGTTKGGAAVGDWIEVEDMLAGYWWITGVTNSSGAEATPFSGS